MRGPERGRDARGCGCWARSARPTWRRWRTSHAASSATWTLAHGEGLAADQLERLSARRSRRWRSPTPRGCWTRPTSAAHSRSRASPPTCPPCTRPLPRRRPDPVLRRTLSAASVSCSQGSFLWHGRCGTQPAGPAHLPQHRAHPGRRARGARPRALAAPPSNSMPRRAIRWYRWPKGASSRRPSTRSSALSAALDYVRIALASMLCRGVRAQREAARHALVRPADGVARRRAGPTWA